VWSVLTVHPTLSLASSAGIVPALLARAGASGFDIDLQAPVTTIRSDVGLVGASVETVGYQSGAPTHYAVAAFSDTRYVYCSELVSRSPESWATHRDAFSSVWRSIEPVPGPRTFEDISDSKPLLHWLD
jgi:hypothetical protein